jgi:hypothetical protein
MSTRLLLELAHLHYLEAMLYPMGSYDRERLLAVAADLNARAQRKKRTA